MATVLPFPQTEALDYVDLTDNCVDCGSFIAGVYYELPVRQGNQVIIKGICSACHRKLLQAT